MIEPLFESKPDHTLMVAFAEKFGFKKELVKNYEMVKDKDGWDEPTPESILKEINTGTWTIGYTGPVAGAAEAAHEEHVDVRREDAARARRSVRRRLLRPAVAVLRDAGTEASRARPTCTTRRGT